MKQEIPTDSPGYRLAIDFQAITQLFYTADEQGRNALFEHETLASPRTIGLIGVSPTNFSRSFLGAEEGGMANATRPKNRVVKPQLETSQ
jgi:hypothetical protein